MSVEANTLARRGMLADPGDHFKGRFEVERKYRVDGLATMRAALSALNAVPFTLGNEERDVFFDDPSRRLAQNGQAQCLRQMNPSGRVLWISKGPRADECIAMDLADFDQAAAMLRSLEFEEVMATAKKRDIYFLGDLHITLDDVERLGTFVELAAMSHDETELARLADVISETAEALGLPASDLEPRSYRAMLSEQSRKMCAYFTAPAAMPLMMKRSSRTPITISGRIAANDNAAIDHQLIPCEPV